MLPFDSTTARQVARFFSDPAGFVLWAFPWGEGELKGHAPDTWQMELLSKIGAELQRGAAADTLQLAVTAGHGVGKSALTAWMILWAMSTRPYLNGVVTANTKAQLQGKTWRELAVWHDRAINKNWFEWTATKFSHVAAPATWSVSAVPNTETNPQAFAGLHADHVLILYDEASTIPDCIWEVSEGAMTTPGAIWGVFGNPTENTGRFRECFGKFEHRWTTYKVDSRSARMTNKKKIQEWIDDYGEDSDFVRVRVRGEFPRASSSQFISSEDVMLAAGRVLQPHLWAGHPRILGVDVARFGSDKSVIIRRQGPKVWQPLAYRQIDTMQLSGYVMDEIRRFRPHAVAIDGSGVGGGVVDRLRHERLPGTRIVEVTFGAQAADRRVYANVRAEIWGRMRDWLKGEVDLPNDQALLEGLPQVMYGFNAKMQLQLERKEHMRERGLESPDECDALAVTFAPTEFSLGSVAGAYSRPVRASTYAYA